MKRVLFVDDEPLVLQGLQRMFYHMRNDWEMRFAGGGNEALQMMKEAPADVVVSDMRMPRMNGAELLNEIMRRHPQTARFILSGYADMELILQCVEGTHQFLSKPCDCETLKNTVQRALDMNGWLDNDTIKTIVSQTNSLPSPPDLYFKIVKELESPNGNLEDVGNAIAQDPGMTAKILQLANSAFFGLRRRIADPSEAVQHLGLDTLKSLVLAIHVFSKFEGMGNVDFPVAKLWRHSFRTAAMARRIAQLEQGEKKLVDESFTAGLLHDLGRLILVANLPEQYEQAATLVKRDGFRLIEAELATFRVTHAEVGGYLLGLWGLPVSIVEAAVFHHHPDRCQTRTFAPLTSVHISNVLEHEADRQLSPRLDDEYLATTGVKDQVPAWREALCRENKQESMP